MPLYRCDHCRDWRLRTARTAALHDTAHWYDQLGDRLSRPAPLTLTVPGQRPATDPLPVAV